MKHHTARPSHFWLASWQLDRAPPPKGKDLYSCLEHVVLGMVVNRGKKEGGGSRRESGGSHSRSSQWKNGGLDGDWEGWQGWEDWDKWEEDPLWPRPSPNAPVDQQWTDVWKEVFLAGYSAASKNTADTAQALANDILGVMDKMELGSRTGSGGAEPESSEVVKKKKKVQEEPQLDRVHAGGPGRNAPVRRQAWKERRALPPRDSKKDTITVREDEERRAVR